MTDDLEARHWKRKPAPRLTQQELDNFNIALEAMMNSRRQHTIPYTGGQYKLDEAFTDAAASIALDGDTVAGCAMCHVNAAI